MLSPGRTESQVQRGNRGTPTAAGPVSLRVPELEPGKPARGRVCPCSRNRKLETPHVVSYNFRGRSERNIEEAKTGVKPGRFCLPFSPQNGKSRLDTGAKCELTTPPMPPLGRGTGRIHRRGLCEGMPFDSSRPSCYWGVPSPLWRKG